MFECDYNPLQINRALVVTTEMVDDNSRAVSNVYYGLRLAAFGRHFVSSFIISVSTLHINVIKFIRW
jgi:hypothetical protein